MVKVCLPKNRLKREKLFSNMEVIGGGSLISFFSHILIGDYDWQIAKNRFLVPLSQKEIGDVNRLNHSCNPNLGVRGQRTTVALRDIKAGEELTLDYAMIATNEPFAWLPIAPAYHFKCLCGSVDCRKVITGNDWKRGDLQEKYAGYFSSYLAEKICKLNLKH